jgi:hypothetical protein
MGTTCTTDVFKSWKLYQRVFRALLSSHFIAIDHRRLLQKLFQDATKTGDVLEG